MLFLVIFDGQPPLPNCRVYGRMDNDAIGRSALPEARPSIPDLPPRFLRRTLCWLRGGV